MLGEEVGNYRIVAQIAAGGMGVVYRAEHVSIGKIVAVKLLLDGLSRDASIVQRFLTEAKAVAAIKHPGIIEIFDYGTLPDGRAYIVMELLEGETLKQRLRRQRPPEAEAIWIARSIASAVGAAHERGIIHRDLKPENIFLVPDPDLPAGERPKVLDFGLAKLTLAEGDGASQRTRTGAVMGTPTYMAPEQCRGAGYVDHRADLYALGCVLYEMTCGRPPFVAQGVGEIIGAHLFAPVEPPRRWNPELSPALEDIILKLLAKSPDERFQTMDELRLAIDASMGRAPTGMPGVHQTAGSLVIPPAARGEAPGRAGASTLGGSAAQVVPTLPVVRGRKARVGWTVGAGVAVLVGVGVALGIGLHGGGDDVAALAVVMDAGAADAAPASRDQEPGDAAPVDAGSVELPADAGAMDAASKDPPAAPATAPATVQLRLRITPGSAEVQVDGKVVSARKLHLSPGQHSITVSAPGYRAQTRTIKVTRDRVETFALERAPVVPPVSTKL